MEASKDSLRKNGQFVSNRIFIWSPSKQTEDYTSLLKMFYKHVYCKYVGDKTYQSANYVFFADNCNQ